MNNNRLFFYCSFVKAISEFARKPCSIRQMRAISFLMFITIGCHLFGITPDSLFVQANEKYKKALYLEAIQLYDSILKQGKHSSELYYNLGDSYYQLGRNGRAIQYFEKAKKLDPNNPDILHNLQLITKTNVDDIEEIPPTIFQSVKTFLFGWLHHEHWGFISIVFAFISFVSFALYFFIGKTSIKQLFFSCFTISFFLVLFSWLGAFFNKSSADKNREAVVIALNTYVKIAPTKESKDAFILHEGTKVRTLDKVDKWVKIRLSDGKTGWIDRDHIGEI